MPSFFPHLKKKEREREREGENKLKFIIICKYFEDFYFTRSNAKLIQNLRFFNNSKVTSVIQQKRGLKQKRNNSCSGKN